jgi:hypothetical protein
MADGPEQAFESPYRIKHTRMTTHAYTEANELVTQ